MSKINIELINRKNGIEFKNPKIFTISLLRNTITISTEEDLNKPFNAQSLTYNLNDVDIIINNTK